MACSCEDCCECWTFLCFRLPWAFIKIFITLGPATVLALFTGIGELFLFWLPALILWPFAICSTPQWTLKTKLFFLLLFPVLWSFIPVVAFCGSLFAWLVVLVVDCFSFTTKSGCHECCCGGHELWRDIKEVNSSVCDFQGKYVCNASEELQRNDIGPGEVPWDIDLLEMVCYWLVFIIGVGIMLPLFCVVMTIKAVPFFVMYCWNLMYKWNRSCTCDSAACFFITLIPALTICLLATTLVVVGVGLASFFVALWMLPIKPLYDAMPDEGFEKALAYQLAFIHSYDRFTNNWLQHWDNGNDYWSCFYCACFESCPSISRNTEAKNFFSIYS